MSTLGTIIERACHRYGDAVAIDDGDRRLTFADVGRATVRVANYYRSLGLRRGDRVAIQMRNGTAYILAEFALYRAGLVKVAVNFRYTPAESSFIVEDSGASAFIVGSATEVDGAGSQVPHLIRAEDILQAAADPSFDTADAVETRPDDLALLQYTSGTTGRPKGAMYTHAARLIIDRDLLAELPGVGPGDVMLHVSPLSHASGAMMIPLFVRGVTQVPAEFAGAGELLEQVRARRATITFLVPTVLNMVAAHTGGRRPEELHDLHTVVYAGSPISPEHLQGALSVFGPSLVQFYGLSEAWLPITCLTKRDHGRERRHLGSAGRPVPFVDVVVRGPGGEVLGPGEPGDICVRGDHVMAGYWNNHRATAESIDADGWLVTGDIGFEDEEGFVHLVDRKNDMIVSGGFNVYPLEVESTLALHPAVVEAAVFGVPDETWGELVAAAVVLRDGSTVEPPELVAHCRDHLAAFKCPRRFEFLDELPRNSTGKVLRRVVRDKHWQGRERAIQG